ncbi:hypothetical protein NDU88_002436 [Pleurodeles waltl]|uniref:Uncharacterized protein n=1 Tax=Pleurodeles waltl TaxID=8319 RepID=A0AAV7WPW1_PLEWA|nr:hypothetical protein NDU88_002436 [Pleurodeles waltl]
MAAHRASSVATSEVYLVVRQTSFQFPVQSKSTEPGHRREAEYTPGLRSRATGDRDRKGQSWFSAVKMVPTVPKH